MKFNTGYNFDGDVISFQTGLKCEDESLTLQSHAEDADINTIVRRFGVTGQLPSGVAAPTYGDFEGIFDYQSAMNAIRAADESFMEMPADVRARFANDPAQFVDFCSNPDNIEELRKMGLALPVKVPAEPVKSEVNNEPNATT